MCVLEFFFMSLLSIKKDMTDISHGYEDLGLLLKDKIGELSTKLSRLQKAQEESSAKDEVAADQSSTATKWHQARHLWTRRLWKLAWTEQGTPVSPRRETRGSDQCPECSRAYSAGLFPASVTISKSGPALLNGFLWRWSQQSLVFTHRRYKDEWAVGCKQLWLCSSSLGFSQSLLEKDDLRARCIRSLF